MKNLLHTTCYLLFFILSTQVYSATDTISVSDLSQKFALVIGNSNYKRSPLTNPVNDAHDIARVLEAVGFQVTLKKNQSQSEMREVIREFGRKIRKGGVGLFYYAGHGMQIKGENFLIPVGNDIQEEDEIADQAIRLSLVLNKMDTAENKMNIVILDACRDNPFTRSFRSTSKGLALVDGPMGTLIAYSTQPGATASDGDSSNGLYTKHLLDNILKPGLTIEQVFKRVRNQVMSDSENKQIPWELSSLTGEDFYFLGDVGSPAPALQVAMLEPAVNQSQPINDSGERNLNFHAPIFGKLFINDGQNDTSDIKRISPFARATDTISISFDIDNLPKGALIKGIWSDAGRKISLQEMFLVTVKKSDRMSFKLKKPFGGFTQGNYTFDIYYEGNVVGSADFEIMK